MNKQEQAALEKVSPLCKDCKHFDDHDGWSDPTCRLAVYSAEPVHGHITYNSCAKERQYPVQKHLRGTQCGPEGKNFEPLPKVVSWFDKIIQWFDGPDEDSIL